MRPSINFFGLFFLCLIAGVVFTATFSFSTENMTAEPLRLFSVALIGAAFYLRQNDTINGLESKLYQMRPVTEFEQWFKNQM